MKYFRGLTKDGKMVYGWLAEIEGKYFIIDIKAELRPLTAYGKYGKPGEGWKEFFGTYGIAGFIEVIPESIAQQVGLKDKNEKEIYEFCEINNKFVILWNFNRYILTDILSGDIVELKKGEQYEITREFIEEYCAVSKD